MGNGADQRSKLQRRVIAAAEGALTRQKYVAPIEVLSMLGWLPWSWIDLWRKNRTAHLEGIAVDETKVRSALGFLRQWAEERGLQPSEVPYLAATRDRQPLRFTERGDEMLELVFRTHWVSPELSAKRREQLEAKQRKAKKPKKVVT